MDCKTIFQSLAAVGLVTSLAGCASTTPNLDKHFGEASHSALSAQVVNPQASANPSPVFGQGGEAAAATIDRYNRSYKQPPPPVNVFSIGVGSGTGSMTTSSGGSAER